jgi:hypothetical protein
MTAQAHSMKRWEMMKLIEETPGVKVRHKDHVDGFYIYVKDGKVMASDERVFMSMAHPDNADGWELYQEPVEMFDGFEAYRRCFAGENVRRNLWQVDDFIYSPGERVLWGNGNSYQVKKSDATATDWMVVK